jgi:hypothetical protein
LDWIGWIWPGQLDLPNPCTPLLYRRKTQLGFMIEKMVILVGPFNFDQSFVWAFPFLSLFIFLE